MVRTQVCQRETKSRKNVNITSLSKPVITKDIQEKWQNIINVVAKLVDVPAGLIMRITKENMEVFLKSTNIDNPYPQDGKDHLGHGLYCETVISQDKPLYVDNALESVVWEDNPDVKLNMISYYGLPIKWADGEFFGTICVLDSKKIQNTINYKKMMELFKDAIETDLENLELIQKLKNAAIMDSLTKVSNRRGIFEQLDQRINSFKESKEIFSVVIFDIDYFKAINDTYGHHVGDKILSSIASLFEKKLSNNDLIGRLGGDEFLLIFRNVNEEVAKTRIDQFIKEIIEDAFLSKYQISISYGIAEITSKIKSSEALIKIADTKMMSKKNYRRK